MAVIFKRSRCFCIFYDVLKPPSLRFQLRTTKIDLGTSSNVVPFDDNRVKSLLKRMTGRNLDKIFVTRRERGFDPPSYQLMTDEELMKVSVI